MYKIINLMMHVKKKSNYQNVFIVYNKICYKKRVKVFFLRYKVTTLNKAKITKLLKPQNSMLKRNKRQNCLKICLSSYRITF